MASPDRQGASSTMGGVFCGCALGNALKAADFKQDHSNFVGPVQGKVRLYNPHIPLCQLDRKSVV